MAIFSLRDVLWTIKEALLLAEKKNKKDANIRKALIDLQLAVLETENYINDRGYSSNTELTRLWLSSFDSIKGSGLYANQRFPEFLYNKARFWGNPEKWLREPGAMELIPTLKEIENECANILELSK
jgi:hypothetical protein